MKLGPVSAALASTVVAVALVSTASAGPLHRTAPPVEGTYKIVFTCTAVCEGTYVHNLTISSYEASAGGFSGTGYSLTAPGQRWTITGTIQSRRVSFHLAYTAGNPGYTLDATGRVANDGSMSGTATDFDRTRPSGSLTWRADKEAPKKTRIAKATRDFEARAKRRISKLKALVENLGPRKETLERRIVAAVPRAREAEAGVAELQPNIAAVEKQLRITRDAVKRLRRADDELPDSVRTLLQAEASLEGTIASLEQEILEARKRGEDVRARNARLGRVRSQLREVEKEIAGNTKASQVSDLRVKWLKSLRALQDKAFDLREAEATLLALQGAADGELTELVTELRDVDRQLFDVAQRLTGFEPEVHEIDVSANGAPVFRAVAGFSYAELFKLNEELEGTARAIEQSVDAKAKAFKDFRAAHDDAIKSLKRLTEVLYSVAYARFLTDLAFDTYDIVRATASGGVVGAFAELGKKLIEKGLSALAGPGQPGIEPGSIEEKINKEFKADLRVSFSQPQIARAVAERVLKETLTKSLKDSANKHLGSLVFEKVELPFRRALGDAPVRPYQLRSQLENFTLKLKRIERLQQQLGSLRNGYFKSLSFGREAENIAKDGLKLLIKDTIDKVETEAWVDFFLKDALARSFWSPYARQADLWREELEHQDSNLAQKAKLLEGVDPKGGLKVQSSKQFDTSARLRVALKLSGFRDPSDPIDVFVGGARATRVGASDVYTVSADTATPESDGTLTVELR